MSEEWQKRVIDEQKQLYDKIINLEHYLEKNDDRLLQVQIRIMEAYNQVLLERIDSWEKDE